MNILRQIGVYRRMSVEDTKNKLVAACCIRKKRLLHISQKGKEIVPQNVFYTY